MLSMLHQFSEKNLFLCKCHFRSTKSVIFSVRDGSLFGQQLLLYESHSQKLFGYICIRKFFLVCVFPFLFHTWLLWTGRCWYAIVFGNFVFHYSISMKSCPAFTGSFQIISPLLPKICVILFIFIPLLSFMVCQMVRKLTDLWYSHSRGALQYFRNIFLYYFSSGLCVRLFSSLFLASN